MTPVQRLLSRAASCHKQGDLDQAESLYRTILRIDPQQADALHLLGVAAHQRGQSDLAVGYIRRAIVLYGRAPLYYNNLGAAYQALGRLEDAAGQYQLALDIDSTAADVWFNLANVRLIENDWQDARRCYEQGLRRDPSCAAAWNNLGHVMQSLDQLEAATNCYERAISLQPGLLDAHFNRGNALELLGRTKEAIGCYQTALECRPGHAGTLFNLAKAYLSLDQLDEAARRFEEAVDIEPGLAGDAYTNLAVAWMRRDALDESERLLRRALKANREHPRAHGILGTVLKRLGRLDESIACYRRGLEGDPRHAETHNNLGTALQEMGSLDEAFECYRNALRINPQYAEAHNNQGTVLHEQCQLDLAIASYRRALEHKPDFADALTNIGTVHSDRREYTEAIAGFRRAIRACPDHVEAHFHLAAALLTLGQFEEGWREYRWRWKRKDFTVRDFGCPEWDGSPLTGKTILVYSEQGIGDEILFASCLPELAGAADCIVECDPRLVPLFARSFPTVRVIGKPAESKLAADRSLADVDWQTAAGSLPGHFRSRMESFPIRPSYLQPDGRRVSAWRKRFQSLGPQLKVGISWRGGRTRDDRLRRSTDLELWSAVFDVPDVAFINLQYGASEDELRRPRPVRIHHWNDVDPLYDLDEFAAQIAALDLVIAVDNATVHLAGALGAPVWALLPFSSDWRWMTSRDDSPWYPSLRLIRQQQPGDWTDVLERTAAELGREVHRRKPAVRPTAGLTGSSNLALALRNRARRLVEQGNRKEAAECLLRAIEIDPDAYEVHNNLGVIWQSLGQLDDALTCYRRSLEIKPDFAPALFNLGNACREQDRLDSARECYERSLELNPRDTDCLLNLGAVLQAQQDLDAADATYGRCLEIEPGNAEARFNRSLVRLGQGRFESGWPEYEWRWADLEQPRPIQQPQWEGSSLADRSILITAEQGIGDEILFASCIDDVAGRAKQCVVECSPRLVPLFSRSFPSAEVVSRPIETTDSARLERVDMQVAAGSIPRYVRPDLSSFPRRSSYLRPDQQLSTGWRTRLAERDPALKVGISWRGGRDPEIRRRRSTSLDQWAPLFAVPGVRFINLQYGDCHDELKRLREGRRVDVYVAEEIDPFEDLDNLAALIAALDLVISVDNATVHLAGSLGVPVWTLLPVACDWRWMTGRDDSPWYPSMRLFRQTRFGVWSDVFGRAARELALFKSTTPAG